MPSEEMTDSTMSDINRKSVENECKNIGIKFISTKKCSENRRLNCKRKFIERCIQKHGNEYDYSLTEYVTSKHNVIIICKKHGKFSQKANTHLSGSGCPACYKFPKSNTKKFIISAIKNKYNRDNYDYSKVNYIDNRTPVIIVCPKHGNFLQSPTNHLNGQRCPYCFGKRQSNTVKFIAEANELHNFKYDYSKTNYKKALEKVIITCRKHGDFHQTPSKHLNAKHGCSKCTKIISDPEIEFLDHLNVRMRNVYINPYRVDGIKDNTIYEFLGDY